MNVHGNPMESTVYGDRVGYDVYQTPAGVDTWGNSPRDIQGNTLGASDCHDASLDGDADSIVNGLMPVDSMQAIYGLCIADIAAQTTIENHTNDWPVVATQDIITCEFPSMNAGTHELSDSSAAFVEAEALDGDWFNYDADGRYLGQ